MDRARIAYLIVDWSQIIIAAATSLAAASGIIGWLHAQARNRVDREFADVREDVSHHRANADQKFDAAHLRLKALESARQADIERIVRVETSVTGIERSLERVEHGQEKLTTQIDDRFRMLADSIREMSVRTPK